jgi:hypothetical protein
LYVVPPISRERPILNFAVSQAALGTNPIRKISHSRSIPLECGLASAAAEPAKKASTACRPHQTRTAFRVFPHCANLAISVPVQINCAARCRSAREIAPRITGRP